MFRSFHISCVLALALLGNACAFEVKTSGNVASVGIEKDTEAMSDLPSGGATDATNSQDTFIFDGMEESIQADAIDSDIYPDAQYTDIGAPECQNDDQCKDPFPCTTDRCNQGVCENAPNDGLCSRTNPCLPESCDPNAGCVSSIAPGIECPLADKCVVLAECSSQGLCEAVEYRYCENSNCKEGSCNPTTGLCDYQFFNDKDCNDSNPCTVDDTCTNGTCKGTYIEGNCSCTADEDCQTYDNADLCDGQLTCISGSCQIADDSVVSCPIAPQETCFSWQCDPSSGKCVKNFDAEGTPCSDQNKCTKLDQCHSGECGGVPANNETNCDLDQDQCTLDSCLDGICEAGPKLLCGPDAPCHHSQCNPTTGFCVHYPVSDEACDDGDPCTLGDTCLTGDCLPGVDVCVDCSDPDLQGHCCDDGRSDTLHDFCFEGRCTGMRITTWETLNADRTLTLMTSIDWVFHLAGIEFIGLQDTWTNRIIKLWTEGEWMPLATVPPEPFADMDGKVAVGPGDQIYYYGGAWTANSDLRNALLAQCPSMGDGVEPKVVSHQTFETNSDSPAAQVSQTVAVGFEVDGSKLLTGCLAALCGYVDGDGWVCRRVTYSALDLDFTSGMKVTATAILAGALSQSCGILEDICPTSPNDPTTLAIRKSGFSNTIELGNITQGLLGLTWESRYKAEFTPAAGPFAPAITAITRTPSGKLLAVGNHGLILTEDLNESGENETVPIPSLQPDMHYSGVRLAEQTLVLSANRFEPTLGEGGNFWVTSGLVVAPASFLDSEAANPESAHFIEIASFPWCSGCYDSTLTRYLGLHGFAWVEEHLATPGTNSGEDPIFGVAGTFPAAGETRLTGTAAIIIQGTQ